MTLLNVYVILTVLGILLNILVLILGNNQGTTEQMAFCFVTGILFLIIGIRGIVVKFKSYM